MTSSSEAILPNNSSGLRCCGIDARSAFLFALWGLGFWSVSTDSVATEPPVAKWPVRGIFVAAAARLGQPLLGGERGEAALGDGAREKA